MPRTTRETFSTLSRSYDDDDRFVFVFVLLSTQKSLAQCVVERHPSSRVTLIVVLFDKHYYVLHSVHRRHTKTGHLLSLHATVGRLS
jgi:hypothetical protein